MVVYGGWHYDEDTKIRSTVDVYNLSEGHVQWSQHKKDAPFGWSRAGVASDDKYFYIVGGSRKLNDTVQYKAAVRYDPEGGLWDELPHIQIRRSKGPAVFIIDHQLFAIGGAMSSVESEVLNLSESNATWQIMNVTFPYTLYDTNAVVVGRTAYICSSGDSPTKTILSWTPGEKFWNQTLTPMKHERRNVHCTVSDGEDFIWVIGPACHQCGTFMEQYTISTNSWQVIDQNLEIDETYDLKHICVYSQGYIYVTFRGPNHEIDENFYAFNVSSKQWIKSGNLKSKSKWPIASTFIT